MNNTFKKSIAWQKGYKLMLEIYKATENFPMDERFGLKSQIRRSAISIPSNIAEGLFRNSKKELAQFMTIAKGSCGELITQIMVSHHLGYISEDKEEVLREKIEEIIKILFSAIKTLKHSRL